MWWGIKHLSLLRKNKMYKLTLSLPKNLYGWCQWFLRIISERFCKPATLTLRMLLHATMHTQSDSSRMSDDVR